MPRRYLAFALLLAAPLLVGCGPASQAQTAPPDLVELPAYDPLDLERRVLDEVNRIRHEHGRPTILPDSALADVARGHSRDMRDRGFVAHRNPSGHAPGERALRAAYRFTEFGENLFRGRLYDIVTESVEGEVRRTFYVWYTPNDLATLVAQMWMESPTHRENMLAGRYDYGGVGVAIGSEHEVFVTLNLSAR